MKTDFRIKKDKLLSLVENSIAELFDSEEQKQEFDEELSQEFDVMLNQGALLAGALAEMASNMGLDDSTFDDVMSSINTIQEELAVLSSKIAADHEDSMSVNKKYPGHPRGISLNEEE